MRFSVWDYFITFRAGLSNNYAHIYVFTRAKGKNAAKTPRNIKKAGRVRLEKPPHANAPPKARRAAFRKKKPPPAKTRIFRSSPQAARRRRARGAFARSHLSPRKERPRNFSRIAPAGVRQTNTELFRPADENPFKIQKATYKVNCFLNNI